MTSEARANTANSSLSYHRIVEAFKFGFAWRSRLGDPAFNNDTKEVRAPRLVKAVCLVLYTTSLKNVLANIPNN